MRRFLIFTGIGVVFIIILFVGIDIMNTRYTKSFSPEDNVSFDQGDLHIEVFYNRPYKKGREIFGKLVPYGKVWRTGANESTSFKTNKEIIIEGKKLKAGTYSLWTIPGPDIWTIIFNKEHGQWGVNSDGEPNRDPARDVLSVKVHSVQQDRLFEQFTIEFTQQNGEAEMVLLWDKTLVTLPFEFK